MKIVPIGLGAISNILISIIFLCDGSVSAQVTPDGTLKTTVSQTGNHFTINDGNRIGNNLFHSFNQFSIPSNGKAVFNNSADIQNIFSRVTGGNRSEIDGLIQAHGSANLFLINPSGIIFGTNARLQLGGSFFGSTASGIKFADGTEFSASLSAPPLLTMSVPIGLQFGTPAAPITVQGSGYGELNSYFSFVPFRQSNRSPGLQVAPGQTLALVGGDVNIEGGKLGAFGGQVILGSVDTGLVSLNSTPIGWKLDYSSASGLRNVTLSQRAIVDTSGLGGGAIELFGRNISLLDDATVLQQNFGTQASAQVQVNASETLQVVGTLTTLNGIVTEALSSGRGGDIRINAGNLMMESGQANTWTFGAGHGGDVLATVQGTIHQSEFSLIANRALATGDAGNLTVAADQLTSDTGSGVNSTTLGIGNSGNINVNARRIDLSGFGPLQISSSISAATLGLGNAGNVTVNTTQLRIRGGGVVDSSTVAFGKAGNVTINATEFIEVRGTEFIEVRGKPTNSYPSSIGSTAGIVEEATRRALKLPEKPVGSGGSVTINTPHLVVAEAGQVSVRNRGTGQAGTLTVNSNFVELDTGGTITALTNSGEGGNIYLNLGDMLLLRRGSQISSEAGGVGNGGNITINAPIITALENSDIIANAFQGNGGSIQITTQGIFGLEFRPQLTPENDITASSQFGISGTVRINDISLNPNSGLVELPTNITDPSQQIATGCTDTQSSRFVATGRGGVPQNPSQQVTGDRTWSDVRDISAYRTTTRVSSPDDPVGSRGKEVLIPPSPETLVQATGWHRNAHGQVELIAIPNASYPHHQAPTTCAQAAIPN